MFCMLVMRIQVPFSTILRCQVATLYVLLCVRAASYAFATLVPPYNHERAFSHQSIRLGCRNDTRALGRTQDIPNLTLCNHVLLVALPLTWTMVLWNDSTKLGKYFSTATTVFTYSLSVWLCAPLEINKKKKRSNFWMVILFAIPVWIRNTACRISNRLQRAKKVSFADQHLEIFTNVSSCLASPQVSSLSSRPFSRKSKSFRVTSHRSGMLSSS